MLRYLWPLCASCVLSLAAVTADADYPWREAGFIPVAIGTPQETLLQYQVMFPDPSIWGPGPYHTVVDYSGYEPATSIFDGLDERVLALGYAIAGVNMRGTHGSGGTFDYFAPQQGMDGADAIEWLAARSWSSGRVSMAGKSWPGISQLYVAAQQPEGLVAIVPGHVFGDLYRDVAFPGGVLNATFTSYWSLARLYEGYVTGPLQFYENQDSQILLNQLGHLPNVVLNPLVKALTHQFDDELYHERSSWYFADQIVAPTFLIQAWQDEQVGGRATQLVSRFSPELPWRLLGTNGDHGEYYGEEVWPHVARFLSYYLAQEIPAGEQQQVLAPFILPNGKPHPVKKVLRPETYEEALARYEAEDRVLINWENGANGGRRANWHATYADWPPPSQTAWKLNLFSNGSLSSAAYPSPPLGWLLGLLTPKALGSVDYKYLPLIGVQERGGYNIEAPFVGGEVVPPGSWTSRPPAGTFAEFTSAPLTADKVMVGTASLDLHIASTAADTDFEVTLSEIRPDGHEVFVQQGWLRASHRKLDPAQSTPLRPYHTHKLLDIAPLIPGAPTAVRIEIFPFAHTFRAGSQIRVAITAPHTHPDLWGFAPMPIPAINTVFTSQVYPSSLVLPVLEGETAGAPYPPADSLRNQPMRIAEPTPPSGPLSPLQLPPLNLDYIEDWTAEVEWLSDVAQNITLPDAALEQGAAAGWLDDWQEEVGVAPVTPTSPELLPDEVVDAWDAYVSSLNLDMNQPDAYFVSLFDDWLNTTG